jgi:hypothetical protein
MRRFDYDGNEEYRDEIDNFLGSEYDDEYDEDYYDEDEDFIRDASLIEIAHANLASLDLNQRLLISAIHVVEKSFLWRFWPLKKKLAAISEAYHTLDILVESIDEPEEE